MNDMRRESRRGPSGLFQAVTKLMRKNTSGLLACLVAIVLCSAFAGAVASAEPVVPENPAESYNTSASKVVWTGKGFKATHGNDAKKEKEDVTVELPPEQDPPEISNDPDPKDDVVEFDASDDAAENENVTVEGDDEISADQDILLPPDDPESEQAENNDEAYDDTQNQYEPPPDYSDDESQNQNEPPPDYSDDESQNQNEPPPDSSDDDENQNEPTPDSSDDDENQEPEYPEDSPSEQDDVVYREVPDVVGQSASEAKRIITEAGLTPDGPNTGTVESQDPVAGTLLEPGQTVSFNTIANATITLTVEADTIGLGNLVGPESVAIYEGESFPGVLARTMEQHGYAVSLDGGYLRSIQRPGITDGWNIPESVLEEHGKDGDSQIDHHQDSLGEFDFNLTGMSGWIYFVNDFEMSTGMENYSPGDGDVVRLHFQI